MPLLQTKVYELVTVPCGSTENRTRSCSFSDYRADLMYTSDPNTVTFPRRKEAFLYLLATPGNYDIPTLNLTGSCSASELRSQFNGFETLLSLSRFTHRFVSLVGFEPTTFCFEDSCSSVEL